MNKKRLGIFLGSIALLIVCSFAAYQYWLAPTRILIINATLAQAADTEHSWSPIFFLIPACLLLLSAGVFFLRRRRK